MKKTIFTLTLTLILMMTLSACNKNAAVSTQTPTSTQKPSIQAMDLPNLEEEILSSYLDEYKKRDSSSFMTKDEQLVFMDMGYNILSDNAISDPSNSDEELYYPLLFEEDNGNLVAIGVNIYGNLDCPDNDMYNLHYAGAEVSGECIVASPHGKVFYNSDTNTIQYWKFGQLLEENKLPSGSVYAGHSFWEGYIFRHKTDVYSIPNISQESPSLEFQPIAHNVKQILTTDYALTSDSWSQPLFLMTDGSVKCYVGWNGSEELSDDISHLSEISSDGGYVGTYYPYNK